MSANMNLKLAAPPQASAAKQENSELIYALPKTYNGKTVNDLFPEFEQDSILRFSKLFGLGRATSLPKIWKGSRKRKKQKTASTSTAPVNQPLQSIQDNSTNNDNNNGTPQPNADDDIFKMLDDAFLPGTLDKENGMADKQPAPAAAEKLDLSRKSISIDKQEALLGGQMDLQFVPDDEIDFMKPFKIYEEQNENKSLSATASEKDKDKSEKVDSTWLNGPAAFWYEKFEPDQYMIKPVDQKLAGKPVKKDDEDSNASMSSEDERSDDQTKAEKKNPKVATAAVTSTECNTINLTESLKSLKVEEEKYLLVSTTDWENDILIELKKAPGTDRNNNSSQPTYVFNQSEEMISERIKYAGWIPSSEHRTLFSYQSKVLGKKVDFLETYKDQASAPTPAPSSKHGAGATAQAAVTWNSIFPNENYELFSQDWEKKIIFDPQNIDASLYNPPEFCIDPNDDNLLLGIPDDPANALVDETNATGAGQTTTSKVKFDMEGVEGKKDKSKLYENRSKMSKNLVGKTSMLREDQNNADVDSDSAMKLIQAASEPKNFWNISNDDYYNPKVVTDQTTMTKNVSTSLVIQHTVEALELRQTFFPTHLNAYKCRQFHRVTLKRFLTGMLMNESQLFPVSSMLKKVYHMGKKIEKPLVTAFQASGPSVPSEFNAIQTANDLTCTDNCEFILAEYSEQFPPLMMQVGMSTKIRNYYKRKFAKDDGPQNLEYGEQVFVNNSPFLGALKPGDSLQSVENFMFRAPIYKHKVPEQDFLLIRSRHAGYTLRADFKTLFVVGQECPLIEVPGPNSKRANSFLKEFLNVFIMRLFHKSRDIPKRIKMEDIKKAFPTQPESSIRKRLKMVADLRRTEKNDTNWWILKEEVRLPTEEEIRSMLSPEQVCAYYSMCAAEQRLKDAGYGEKNLFASDDDDVDNIKIDDEVKNAPWHTTRAYIDATKGKCLLQINGVADPTGRGEGFSYVRQAFKNKNEDDKEEKAEKAAKANKEKEAEDLATASPQPAAQTKRTVTGTDADLRRLHLSQAKELLASYGVPDHEIKKLKRWEIIDVVRTMSTQKAKEGNGSAVSKFARGNRYSQSDAHEKFREECQSLFDMQNRNLASEEFLSTDDDEDLDEDSDVDEMGKNLESMLQSKIETPENSAKSTNEANKGSNKPMDKSTELKNLIMSKPSSLDTPQTDSKATAVPQEVPSNMHRILKITRTFRDEETGREFTKVEIVKKPLIIEAYVKIRSTKDDEFIRSAFALDETEKEKLRKERRRLQEQLRRVKRNEAKRATGKGYNSPSIDGVPHKPRKYNKSGLPRKTKKSVKLIANGVEDGDSAKKNKSLMQYSSADDDKSMSYATGEMNSDMADQSQSNLLDTTASDLNNTVTGPGGVPIVKKRKYVKRKKPDNPLANNDASTPSGETGLSKVEGTKLIIQKKALTLNSSLEHTPGGKIKKPRMTKKQLLNAQMSSSLMAVESNPADGSGDPNQSLNKVPKLKIVNKDKQRNPSLILKIPKDAMSGQEPGEVGVRSIGGSDANQSLIEQSPSKSKLSTPNQPKRTYNKTNSLLKKQQKMMLQQQASVQQQLEQQLKIQMANPLANQEQFAAAVAAASQLQFAGLLEMQQMLMQQQMTGQSPVPVTPGSGKKFLSSQMSTGSTSGHYNTDSPSQVTKRKPSTQNVQQMDYLIKPHMKKVDRRHADPLVSYASILENILNELRDSPFAQPFILPVNSKKVPDYYNLIKAPVDLQTIRKRINDKLYKNRGEFLEDFQQLVENSGLYNGYNHHITTQAESLFQLCEQKIEEKKDKLLRLEKAINPLLDDDSQIALNYLLNQIFEQNIMTVENSFAFLKPVNKGKYKDYYDVIKSPIDLEAIKNKIHTKKYKSREGFISDFELLYNNCLTYNGLNNSYTNTAQKLLNACKKACTSEYQDKLQHLEEMSIQNEDDNSQSTYTPGPVRSSFSIDNVTDNDSNLTANQPDDYEPGQANVPIPILSMSKKLKSLNKKISTVNQNTKNRYSVSLTKQTSNVKASTSSSAAAADKNQFFFPSIPNYKDSPKSGSDADVFVDVESIDDRGYSLSQSMQASKKSSLKANVDMAEYESDSGNPYNEDF